MVGHDHEITNCSIVKEFSHYVIPCLCCQTPLKVGCILCKKNIRVFTFPKLFVCSQSVVDCIQYRDAPLRSLKSNSVNTSS